jgi:ABC-type phosphonate transport system ATPase subunit
VNIVVGRKGAGKTALFIQIRDKIRSDKRNVVVDLKPEGYQLLKGTSKNRRFQQRAD